MNVIKEFRNDLLKRTEVEAEIDYDSSPGEDKVRKDVASNFKAEENQVSVKSIYSNFGSKTFKVTAFVYDSEKDKVKIEPKKKEKKK